ncbi:MAG: phosphoribosyl-AMP cyclohydrolase [Deltaproteobacteria bacterium]|mgnify:CR=1 FL=1|nr:MAG: phosphoribosyl-AMP cyclohydrolase [Deltaproteobacteria bacterium]
MAVKLDFEKLGGLIPAVVQDYQTGEVLMVAFMNEEAWQRTLETGMATYWSRSRGELWVKGATSGNFQEVKEIYVDCDNDTVLLKVVQHGGCACHTGYRSCFYRRLKDGELEVVGQKVREVEK